MEIHAQEVGVDGPHGPLLRPTSLRIRPGELKLVAGEPGTGHTALALALAGQIRPSTGVVLVDGVPDPAMLRKRVAVVDAPQVTEPDDGLQLSDVVAEELALAGAHGSRKAVTRWLAEHDASRYADSRVHNVPAAVRTRVLVELAASRPGIELLILDCPDRHTDDARTWWERARDATATRRAVLVLCSNSSARLLRVPAAHLGEPEPTGPPAARPAQPGAGGPGPLALVPTAQPQEKP